MGRVLTYRDRFGREPQLLARSPGRVNLIGEHTDYNEGFVLPAAINRYTKFAAAPRDGRTVTVHSDTMNESVEIDLDGHLGLIGNAANWANYVRGTVAYLREAGLSPVGCDILLWGDLPVGAGLSSSASFVMGLLGTMLGIAGSDLPRRDLALAAQSIENDFIGVPSGIMDQMAIAVSEPDSAVMIDCRSLEASVVPLHLAANNLQLLIVNSSISRDLANSSYAKRRKECEAAIGALKVITYNLDLQSLRDVTFDMLHQFGGKLYPTHYKRARHVVTENRRVLQTADALISNDFVTAGQLMNESHESLRDDFEVSNVFMDRLVEFAQNTDGVLGARLTGAGFGGCTVNLVKTDALRDFEKNVVRRYNEETSLQAEMYVVRPMGGLNIEHL